LGLGGLDLGLGLKKITIEKNFITIYTKKSLMAIGPKIYTSDLKHTNVIFNIRVVNAYPDLKSVKGKPSKKNNKNMFKLLCLNVHKAY